MTQLVDLIDEHHHALNYDLMRCGSRLRDWPDNGVTWGDLVSLVTHAQPDSATFKAMNPQWQQDVSTDLLRSIEVSLRWLQWAKTPDAPKGRNVPEPFLWPWEQPEEESIKGDAMTLAEAADWLKWDRELKSD
jgi:hypothetical protein